MLLCVVYFLFAAVASGREGESMRIREKRHKALIEELSDADRSMITELNAQGMSATHIKKQLGLEKGEDYVREVLEALSAQQQREPLRRVARGGSGKLPAFKTASSSDPRKVAAKHREKKENIPRRDKSRRIA